MKRMTVLLAALLISLPAMAQTHQGVGVVKGVDQAKGIVTLKHEAIKSLNWPGMTMKFDVRERKVLSTVKPEQKVTFDFVEEKGRYVIVGFK